MKAAEFKELIADKDAADAKIAKKRAVLDREEKENHRKFELQTRRLGERVIGGLDHVGYTDRLAAAAERILTLAERLDYRRPGYLVGQETGEFGVPMFTSDEKEWSVGLHAAKYDVSMYPAWAESEGPAYEISATWRRIIVRPVSIAESAKSIRTDKRSAAEEFELHYLEMVPGLIAVEEAVEFAETYFAQMDQSPSMPS